jgi:hypothetical protein
LLVYDLLTLRRANVSNTAPIRLAPVFDLGPLDRRVPAEIREKILEYSLPSGETYRFDGVQLKAVSASAIPDLGIFLVNRRVYRNTMRIWLEKNKFDLPANAPKRSEYDCVGYEEVRQDNIENCIQWIVSMAEFIPHINATVVCSRRVELFFEQFFELVKLLSTKEVFIAINGTLPRYHSAIGPRERRINIRFPTPLDRRTKILHLELFDLGHKARKFQWSMDRLKTLHDGILKGSEWPVDIGKPIRVFPSGPTLQFWIPRNCFRVHFGPHNLLYYTHEAALRSRMAVSRGERPTMISPFFAKRIVAWLKRYRQGLRERLDGYEESFRRGPTLISFSPSRLDCYDLRLSSHLCGLLFGVWGNWYPISSVCTKEEVERYILDCSTELYRADVHIAAMDPYTTCRGSFVVANSYTATTKPTSIEKLEWNRHLAGRP